MPRPKLPADTAKARHISVRASNTERYLIKLAARELQITESAFILKAIRAQLTPEASRPAFILAPLQRRALGAD
jgi:hypothetical protein